MQDASMPDQRDDRPADRPFVESASGTTDPANSSSGPLAYVLFAVAIGVIVVLFLGLTSCVGSLGQIVAASSGTDVLVPNRHELELSPDDLYDTDAELEWLLEQLYGGSGSGDVLRIRS